MGKHKSQSFEQLHQFAYRGYLIQRRSDAGYSITRDGCVIQHQTPTVQSAKSIIDLIA
jgi:hypothetical protein